MADGMPLNNPLPTPLYVVTIFSNTLNNSMYMLSRLLLLTVILLTGSCLSAVFAQAPQQFNYQAVIRDDHGQPLANKTVQLRLRIRHGGANGAAHYTEVRTITTNEFGLATVAVNSPGADQQQGSIWLVDWANGTKFLQVEVDHDKDGVFTDMGATQILSVPYAMFATPSGNASGDLGGKYPDPAVTKLQGQELDLSAQKYHGYTLKWDQVNNKWVTGKDEDGGPDFYFKASKNAGVKEEFKTYQPVGFFTTLAHYPMSPSIYNATNLLRFPHEESDMYGVFDDSVFTAPTDGMYEFEAVVHFMKLFGLRTKAPIGGCWMGVFRNDDYVGMTWKVYENSEEADQKPMRLKRTIFLQQGDKMKFRFSHNYVTNEPVSIGYLGGNIVSMNNFLDYEGMYITGRKIR
jgi:hypothetical protein